MGDMRQEMNEMMGMDQQKASSISQQFRQAGSVGQLGVDQMIRENYRAKSEEQNLNNKQQQEEQAKQQQDRFIRDQTEQRHEQDQGMEL